MDRFKLKIGLGAIPIFGFFIALFWGMASVYAINRRRMQVFFYGVISILGMLVVTIPMYIGIYFFMQNVDKTYTALIVGGLLSIIIVGLYFMTAICLAVQYLYCKKLIDRQNTQYLS